MVRGETSTPTKLRVNMMETIKLKLHSQRYQIVLLLFNVVNICLYKELGRVREEGYKGKREEGRSVDYM